MLEFNYSERLDTLIQGLDWRIQLPPTWARFFEESGATSTLPNDERNSCRMRIRTHGLLHFETSLPTVPNVPRGTESLGIYTRDFSRRGCGFVSPIQIYPEETVRIVLATFWIRLRVVRARRVGPACYEIGGVLTERHQPSPDAFDGISLAYPIAATA